MSNPSNLQFCYNSKSFVFDPKLSKNQHKALNDLLDARNILIGIDDKKALKEVIVHLFRALKIQG